MAGFSLILIGSNQGQRELIISQSIKMLAERCGEVLLVSSLYETEPWGFIAEQNFLNQVVALDTEMNPYDLLRELLMIEKELGRKRHDVEAIWREMKQKGIMLPTGSYDENKSLAK